MTPVYNTPQHEALYDNTKPNISSQYSLVGPASDGLVGGATHAPPTWSIHVYGSLVG